MVSHRVAFLVACALSLSACQSEFGGLLNKAGIDEPVPADVAKSAAELEKTISNTNNSALKPQQYIAHGYNHIDKECDRFFDALVALQTRTTFGRRQLSIIGGATAGVLGIAQAAAKEIALVAIGFAATDLTVENFEEVALIAPIASEVRVLVRDARAAYQQAAPASGIADSDPFAVQKAHALVRGYARLCSPAGIQDFVKQALQSRTPQVKPATLSVFDHAILDRVTDEANVAGFSDQQFADLYYFVLEGFATPAVRTRFNTAYPHLANRFIDASGNRTAAGSRITDIMRRLDANPAFRGLVDEARRTFNPPPAPVAAGAAPGTATPSSGASSTQAAPIPPAAGSATPPAPANPSAVPTLIPPLLPTGRTFSVPNIVIGR